MIPRTGDAVTVGRFTRFLRQSAAVFARNAERRRSEGQPGLARYLERRVTAIKRTISELEGLPQDQTLPQERPP